MIEIYTKWIHRPTDRRCAVSWSGLVSTNGIGDNVVVRAGALFRDSFGRALTAMHLSHARSLLPSVSSFLFPSLHTSPSTSLFMSLFLSLFLSRVPRYRTLELPEVSSPLAGSELAGPGLGRLSLIGAQCSTSSSSDLDSDLSKRFVALDGFISSSIRNNAAPHHRVNGLSATS